MEGAYKALIVDDNFYNRDIFHNALEIAGYKVKEAENGTTGLAILAEETFNLLVLDLQMPDINGLDVLKQVKLDARHNKMRVLVVTANPHMVTEFLEEETDYVMQKPINVVEFTTFASRIKKVTSPLTPPNSLKDKDLDGPKVDPNPPNPTTADPYETPMLGNPISPSSDAAEQAASSDTLPPSTPNSSELKV